MQRKLSFFPIVFHHSLENEAQFISEVSSKDVKRVEMETTLLILKLLQMMLAC